MCYRSSVPWLAAFVSCLVVLELGAPAPGQDVGSPVSPAGSPQDPAVIYRLDLLNTRLAPVKQNELKTGYIYCHFSPRSGQWVWSFYQGGGSFWYAMGEGTIQEAWQFDLQGTPAEINERLKAMPQLSQMMSISGRSACLTLQANGEWKIAGSGLASSVFNAETGERWQAHGNDYIRVVHSGGRSWTVSNGHYYPAGSPAIRP